MRIRVGSVHADNRANVAYLKRWNGRVKLNWNFDDNANPQYGSVSRGNCSFFITPRCSRAGRDFL